LKKISIPEMVVARMMENDLFSQWMGIRVEHVSAGACRLGMTVRREMLNGFSIAHGGIAFSLADSALAFASNSHNRKSLVIDTSASFTSPVREGDELIAEATEINLGPKLGVYQVIVARKDGSRVLILKGTVFHKPEIWFPEAE
jgi:acyl-CoA thioesterase